MDMRSIEKVGKDIDDVITEALIELGVSRDEVDIEVLSKGSKGFFGLGAKDTRVRVTLKVPEIDEQLEKLTPKEVIAQKLQAVELLDPKQETEVSEKEVSKKEIKSEGDTEDLVVASEEEVKAVINNAEQFLKKLLIQMKVECEIYSEIINNNRISIRLEGKNMGIIIGKRGETLDAIQYLVNIVANKKRTDYIKIMVDTENYRARREETLKNLAFKLSRKVQKSRKPIVLEPMNPYDRRIIHSALQDNQFVKTHSEGKEPFRKVVITPSYHNRVYK